DPRLRHTQPAHRFLGGLPVFGDLFLAAGQVQVGDQFGELLLVDLIAVVIVPLDDFLLVFRVFASHENRRSSGRERKPGAEGRHRPCRRSLSHDPPACQVVCPPTCRKAWSDAAPARAHELGECSSASAAQAASPNGSASFSASAASQCSASTEVISPSSASPSSASAGLATGGFVR